MTFPKISIKAARVNAELNQWEAAEAIGINRRSLQYFEAGLSVPRWDVALKMAEVYNMPIDFLRFGKNTALSGSGTNNGQHQLANEGLPDSP